MIDDADMH